MVDLAPRVRWWYCPSCKNGFHSETEPPTDTVTHECPAHNGMLLPIPEVSGPDAVADVRHIINPRDDDGTVGSVSLEYGSGRVDCQVFPKVANSDAEAHI